MSIFTEPYDASDDRFKELLAIAITGYRNKKEIQGFVEKIKGADLYVYVNWDGAVADVWPNVLEASAKRRKLRALVEALRDDPNYAQVNKRLVALLVAADRERRYERSDAGMAIDPCQATLVSGRPFVNRVRLRQNLQTLFSAGGNQTMIVNGPRDSGKSWTWVLLAHVARKAGGMPAYLFDLSKFKDTQMSPKDVADIIAVDLGLPKPEVDEQAQDATKGRVLLGWLKNSLQNHDPVCLVFDGLDGANLADATVGFIGDIAAAAGNDELGENRVALLAFGGALSNPGVDPFVLREPTLAPIPLADLMAFFKALAAEGGKELADDQARVVAERLFGSPPPDPVPVASMRERASEIGKAASQLRVGG